LLQNIPYHRAKYGKTLYINKILQFDRYAVLVVEEEVVVVDW